jgi:hypothetical protein
VVAKQPLAHFLPAPPGVLRVCCGAYLRVQGEDLPFPVEQVEHISHGLFTDRQRRQPSVVAMGKLVVALLVGAVLVGPAAAASVRPVSGAPRSRSPQGRQPQLPADRMLHGYSYDSWSYRNNVLRVGFCPARSTIAWTVAPMTGTAPGASKGFQLREQVWFCAQAGGYAQVAGVGMDGRALQLPPRARRRRRARGVRLSTVVASAKRY